MNADIDLQKSTFLQIAFGQEERNIYVIACLHIKGDARGDINVLFMTDIFGVLIII